MDSIKVSKEEIKELGKTINKLSNKIPLYQFGIAIGILISILSLVYYLMNPDIIQGAISIFVIGTLIFSLNLISNKQTKKRINQLQKDYNKLQEIYNKQEGLM